MDPDTLFRIVTACRVIVATIASVGARSDHRIALRPFTAILVCYPFNDNIVFVLTQGDTLEGLSNPFDAELDTARTLPRLICAALPPGKMGPVLLFWHLARIWSLSVRSATHGIFIDRRA